MKLTTNLTRKTFISLIKKHWKLFYRILCLTGPVVYIYIYFISLSKDAYEIYNFQTFFKNFIPFYILKYIFIPSYVDKIKRYCFSFCSVCACPSYTIFYNKMSALYFQTKWCTKNEVHCHIILWTIRNVNETNVS